MRGNAAALLVTSLSLMLSCSGFCSRIKAQPLISTDLGSEAYPSGHKVLWQEDVYVRLRPHDFVVVLGTVVLTEERLHAFVVPKTPSCKPLSMEELVREASNDTDTDKFFKIMYRRDPSSPLERVTYLKGWDELINWPTAPAVRQIKFVQIEHEDGKREHVNEFQGGDFYRVRDFAREKLRNHDSPYCAYPEPAASITISTITVNVDDVTTQTKLHRVARGVRCFVIAGCSDDECRERLVWHVCSMSGTGDGLHDAIVKAHMKINDLKELLGTAVSMAVRNRELNFADLGHGLTLDHVATAFEQGVIPKTGGKNSKSGASFFYSSDKTYIAKRIRDVEYNEAVLKMIAGDKYRNHLRGGSILCPTYLAFQSAGESWIVSRTEQFTSEMNALLPSKGVQNSRQFFFDIKPSPLTSDRKIMLKQMRIEFLTWQFSLARLDGWDSMAQILSRDLDFLEQHQVVDYSLWVYGKLFDLPSEQRVRDFKTIFYTLRASADRPGCVFGCQPPLNRPLADVTGLMGSDNRVSNNGKEYKCCCVDLSPIDASEILSPCVLKSLDAPPVRSGFSKTGCGSLVGENWHSFLNMYTYKHRCLVALGVAGGVDRDIHGDTGLPESERWPDEERWPPYVLAPESLGVSYNRTMAAVSMHWRCGVVCFSIGDYFLRFGNWEQFENAALVVWYLGLKWTGYKDKIKSLLMDVGRPTLAGNESVARLLLNRVVKAV